MQKHFDIIPSDPYADALLRNLVDSKPASVIAKDIYAEELLYNDIGKETTKILLEKLPVDGSTIPEWQKAEVRRRIEALKNNPNETYTWEEVEKYLDED